MDETNAMVLSSDQIVASAMTTVEMNAQISKLEEIRSMVMKNGVDYGVVKGCGKKPTLLKAGSEKILSGFRIGVDPRVTDLSTPDEIRYRVEAKGFYIPTGVYLGSGIGEASSSEEKYKWREAVCEAEYNATPEDMRRIKFKKWEGVVSQIKQVRTNPSDVANTILKMAKKRGQVDMTLTVTGASSMFTQDLEDMAGKTIDTTAETSKAPVSQPTAQAPADDQEPAPKNPFLIDVQKEDGTPAVDADGVLLSMKVRPVKFKSSGKSGHMTDFIIGKDGSEMLISMFGKKDDLIANTKLHFFDVTFSVWKDQKQYLAQDVAVG